MTPELTCPKCANKLTFVQATDFQGYSCMDTPACVYRLPVLKIAVDLLDKVGRVQGHGESYTARELYSAEFELFEKVLANQRK